MGPSDGLGVLGVAGSGVVGPLYSRPQTPHSGVGRRLVLSSTPTDIDTDKCRMTKLFLSMNFFRFYRGEPLMYQRWY